MKKYNLECIVLKHIKLGDNDKLYTLLSKDMGKITGFAKGVRKISSKRSGSLDTLNRVMVGIDQESSDRRYITEVAVIDGFKNIKDSLLLMKSCFYLCELVYKSTFEDDDAVMLYNALLDTITNLNALDSHSNNIELKARVIVNAFELKFTKLLGYHQKESITLPFAQLLREKRYSDANLHVKGFVKDVLGEEYKSLEI